MIRIQRLNRPNKKSGHALLPGKDTTVKGIHIVNQTKGITVYVDKFTSPVVKKKSKKKKK